MQLSVGKTNFCPIFGITKYINLYIFILGLLV